MPSRPLSPKPPTLRDLAAKTGLSVGTISLSLRHHPSIPAATRQRVLDAAKAVGYQPNALVNALMAQVRQRARLRPTGEVVTFLTSYETEDSWKRNTPSLVSQYEGAQQRARELGFDLQPMWLGALGGQSRQAARILRARGVRGSLLAPLGVDHAVLELDWSDHTVIGIGYSFRQVALSRSAHHNLSIILACYSNLRKLGYRRIGMVMQKEADTRVHHSWISGYLGSQHVYGGEAIPPLMLEATDNLVPGAFDDWLDRSRPDAIISGWSTRFLERLSDRGLKVPADIGYATLDLGEDRIGTLAGVLQDNRNVGAAAMDLLAGQLFRNEIGIPPIPKVTMIEGTWMDGPTVERRNPAAP